MIIYEVNLTIKKAIWSEYFQWLEAHIYGDQGMLSFPGFIKVDYLLPVQTNANSEVIQITVHYSVRSIDDLNHYFEQHAESMRADGIKRFGQQFSATRRVLACKAYLGDCFDIGTSLKS